MKFEPHFQGETVFEKNILLLYPKSEFSIKLCSKKIAKGRCFHFKELNKIVDNRI